MVLLPFSQYGIEGLTNGRMAMGGVVFTIEKITQSSTAPLKSIYQFRRENWFTSLCTSECHSAVSIPKRHNPLLLNLQSEAGAIVRRNVTIFRNGFTFNRF